MARSLLIIVLISGLALWGMSALLDQLLTPPESLQSHTPLPPSQYQENFPIFTEAELDKMAFDSTAYINQLRESVDLNRLTIQTQLNQAALNHSIYSVHNDFHGHLETEGLPHFTGKTPDNRAKAVGFSSATSEVISYNRDHPELFVGDLMSAIYHRLGLLKMDIDLIGTGIAQDTEGKVKTTFTALTSNSATAKLCRQQTQPRPGELFFKDYCKDNVRVSVKAIQKAKSQVAMQNPKLVVWPKEGGRVQPVFYEESPDPLPECNVSGYPPHIQVNPIYQGRIQFLPNSFRLFEMVNGEKQPVQAIKTFTNLEDPNRNRHGNDPHHQPKHQWYAFFPTLRLNWNSHYMAQVQFKENGQITTKRWQFYTDKQPGLINIQSRRGNKVPLPIRVGEIKTLYFKPRTCSAPQTASIYSGNPLHVKMKQKFIDGQTLQIQLTQARKGDIIKLRYQPTQTLITFEVY